MLKRIDVAMLCRIHGGRCGKRVQHLVSMFSVIGSFGAIPALLPLVIIGRTRPFVGRGAWVLVVTAGAVFVLKYLVRRPRPYLTHGSIRPIGATPIDYSWPSGHVAGAFALAVFILRSALSEGHRDLTPIGLAGLIIAFALAYSRVFQGLHYPSDVVAACAIGTICSVLAA